MRHLDLPPGPATLQVEAEPDEREGDTDRLRVLPGVLRAERVNDVLVDERQIAVGERVRRECVVGVAIGARRPSQSPSCTMSAVTIPNIPSGPSATG